MWSGLQIEATVGATGQQVVGATDCSNGRGCKDKITSGLQGLDTDAAIREENPARGELVEPQRNYQCLVLMMRLPRRPDEIGTPRNDILVINVLELGGDPAHGEPNSSGILSINKSRPEHRLRPTDLH